MPRVQSSEEGKEDPLAVLEAAYRLDGTESDWLAGVMLAARPMMDAGLGTIAFTVHATSLPPAKVDLILVDGVPAPHMRSLVEHMVNGGGRREDASPSGGLPCSPCATMSSDQPQSVYRQFAEQVGGFGMKDALFLNALDPSGYGCVVAAGLPAPRRLRPEVRQLWTRVAVHVTAGHRLRRRLQAGASAVIEAEAVLRPTGEVEHATGPAGSRESMARLRATALARERARGQFGRAQPQRALAEWTGLVAARWTLVDQFDRDGDRYLLARRNDVELGGLEVLSERERQAVAYAGLGHSNKLIAYEMGLSASTVGVLLWRASTKLGVSSRAELIALARRAGGQR
jgi:DNA-binding CsgD family transcriptional regulator